MAGPSEAEIRAWCVTYLARSLDRVPAEISTEVKFARLGLDSANAAHFILELEEWLGLELEVEIVGEYPTVAALARHLVSARHDKAPG